MSDIQHLNNLVRQGRDRAEQHMPQLEDAYAALLRSGGRMAAHNFEQQVVRAGVTESGTVTAATDPWQPPTGDLLDTDELQADAAAKITPLHKRILRATSPAPDLGIAFDVAHPTSQALLGGIGKRLGSLSDAIREQVNESVRDGHAQGWSVAKTAAAIRSKVDEVTPGRAQMLARCLPGEALVDAAVVGAVSRRWYEGDMTVLRTESGREFTATPNHPMLTTRGWIGAGELQEGDDLVGRFISDDPRSSGDKDVTGPPTPISEIFDATATVGAVQRLEGRKPDFHGDGFESEVEIATPYRELALGVFAPLDQELLHPLLSLSDEVRTTIFCAACARLLSVDKRVCVCERSSGDSSFSQNASDKDACYSERVRDTSYTFSLCESLYDEVGGNIGTEVRRSTALLDEDRSRVAERTRDASEFDRPLHEGVSFAYEGCDLPTGVSFLVQADRVVSAKCKAFIGHVFNITSPHGYFIANGCYTGNTDLNALSNGASLDAAQQVGVASKTWLATNDQATRETHADADGQTVPLDQPFTVGDEQAQYPADPDLSDAESANCRCSLTYGDSLAASALPPEGGEMNENNTTSTFGAPGVTIAEDGTIIMKGAGGQGGTLSSLTAAASGDTTLPLSDRDRAWDAGEATARVKKWASSDGSGDPDKIDYSKLARAYFWKDSDGSAIGDYKFPFGDIVNGKLTAVWRGVTAGAQRLSSAKGVDVGAIQKRMTPYYAKAASQYDDKTIMPPWADGKHASLMETVAALRELEPGGFLSVPDDMLVAIHQVMFAARSKHKYAGTGGKCAICGEMASDKDAHYQALTAGISEFTIVAAAGPGEPTRWVAPAIAVENQPTEDGRVLMGGSVSWRPGVLPLGVMLDTPHGDISSAPLAGGIDMLERIGPVISAGGYFNDHLDPELAPDLVAAALQAIEGIRSGSLTGISVDLMVMDGGVISESALDPDGEDELPSEVGEDLGYPTLEDPDGDGDIDLGRMLQAVYQGVIGGACIVPVPAIGNASIAVVAAGSFERYILTSPLFEDCGCDDVMVAAALPAQEFPVKPPLLPPKEWFENPGLDKPTPLTITDDGRVFGHVAPEGVCHEGFRGQCVLAPRSRMGYRKFMNGEIPVAGGERVTVGKLTLKAGHAGTRGVSEAQARAHYDNTASIAAFVKAGDDRHGIWVAGALKSDIPPEVIRDLMASPLSGDWRNGEMVAAHAVIDPGFPVLRASGLGELFEDEEEAEPVSPLAYLRPGKKKAA